MIPAGRQRDGHATVDRASQLGAAARRLFLCIAVCAVPLMLGACVGNVHLSFLDAQGPVAAEQRWHFYWVLGIMGVLVAGPIFLLTPFWIWRYRYGNRASRYTPKWNFSRVLEIMSWGGPIIIVCVLAYFVWLDSHKLDPYKPLASNQPALRVQVIGYDWKWLFIYPDLHIATVGTMALPAGRPVTLELTSATVMQSFFIPALGSQIYAMGGMVTQLHLEASRPGRYLGENTMYNGDGFHQQKFTAVGMSAAAFQAWARKVRSGGVPMDARIFKLLAARNTRAELAAELPAGAVRGGTVYLTGVSPGLFAAIVKGIKRGTFVAGRPARGAASRKSAQSPVGTGS